ncbi:hypothetical protein Acr_00g0060920 [Actinidia rufa]|uniref:Uncharacterized protein n=1 Tax=Actinidia rufa TaxID=165716 RepID=A0A7J0DPZ9_9ERIC|nr:hypothetical protein Acr_00g0060920 [Actinidia rufa]
MHSRSEVGDLGNLEDSLPSWITTHLGEGSSSFMTDEGIPEEGETITSTSPGEVAFYQAAFLAGLQFPIHPTIRNLFSLNNNPKPDHGWLYFEARYKKTLLEGYPTTLRVRRENFSSPREKTGSSPKAHLVEEKGLYSIPALLESKSFCRVVGSCQPMAFSKENKGEDRPTDDVPTSLGDEFHWMTRIPMKSSSFLAYVEGLVIDIIGLVLGQYFDRFENCHPNDVRGEIIEFSKLVLKEEVVDYLQ